MQDKFTDDPTYDKYIPGVGDAMLYLLAAKWKCDLRVFLPT